MIKSQNFTSYLVHVKCIKDYKVNGNLECKKGKTGFLQIVMGPAPIPYHWNQATSFDKVELAQDWVDHVNGDWNEYFVGTLAEVTTTVDFKYKINGSWT